jgi:hypothetical protein
VAAVQKELHRLAHFAVAEDEYPELIINFHRQDARVARNI